MKIFLGIVTSMEMLKTKIQQQSKILQRKVRFWIAIYYATLLPQRKCKQRECVYTLQSPMKTEVLPSSSRKPPVLLGLCRELDWECWDCVSSRWRIHEQVASTQNQKTMKRLVQNTIQSLSGFRIQGRLHHRKAMPSPERHRISVDWGLIQER